MVASLQTKKEVLESKLKDKTSELRKLCLEEAELTGVLPPETPLEPGESPPQFRRRIATAYTLPVNLINKLKSKEDETLAALELECRIQTGIAEAALGLSNDGSASKSVRRKHRVLYEETQNRLHELENRLSTLKQQALPKHKKKPRPQTEIANDSFVDRDEVDIAEIARTHPIQINLSNKSCHVPMKHSHTYCGYPIFEENLLPYHQRFVNSHMVLPVVDHRQSMMIPELNHVIRSNNPSPIDNSTWVQKGREVWQYQMNNQLRTPSSDHFYIEPGHTYDRFGSLDRNSQLYAVETMSDNRSASTLPRNMVGMNQSNSTILLPGQTYPESSLMRTQSLGSVESSNKSLVLSSDRKIKEKEWHESCLDSSPLVPSPLEPKSGPPGTIKHSDSNLNTNSEELVQKIVSSPAELDQDKSKMNQASISHIQFDTVVPYESPRNHTVVQAGKWQPYREVTKPFEMSDFYKYSTKFRQFKVQVQSDSKVNAQRNIVQQKAAYKPLQPLECKPIAANKNDGRTAKISVPPSCVMPYSTKWFHEKNNHSKQPRPSTLV